ncbi:MAG: AAA family ATPase [Candidatus Omnitrophica bacterium]|nr:AAA family ATPase [Candidatus Omnitrophota bacterium]
MFSNSSKNQKILIAIEGVDGVGKTTIAKELVKRNNYKLIKSPLEDTNSVKPFFEDRLKIFPLSRFLFYLSSIWEVYFTIQQDSSNKIFIIDRYILSTLLYHKVLFSNLKFENANTFFDANIFPPEPDLNIILYCDKNIRQERIYNRRKNISSIDKVFEDDQNLLDAVQSYFISLPDVIKIDTGLYSIQKVTEKCELEIKKIINKKTRTLLCY